MVYVSTLSRKRRGEWCILAHYPLKNSRIVEKQQIKFHQSIRMCANICHSYEWGYTAGPPMAVAPLPNVREVLDYAVTEIPREKIYLGIPNYGYDWPLPFAEGRTRARSLSNQEAVELAVRYGAEIQFDAAAQAPWFNYTAPDGVPHVVWFEDARSMSAKLRLIREYGLYGAGYWNLMRPYPQGWAVLNALYETANG